MVSKPWQFHVGKMKIPWKPTESDHENPMASPWYYHGFNLPVFHGIPMVSKPWQII